MNQVKRKVLVIDDEPNNIKVLYKGLCHLYQVLGASSGEEGIKTAIKEKPDVILSDIMMDGINGYEVLMRLRENPETNHIPIIFLSGLDMPEDESYGLELGADDYISKPFNQAVVRARIKTQLKIVSQKEQIEFLASHCTLTNLANPKLLSKYFDSTMQHKEQHPIVALLYMDLNSFKPINDTYGHDAGDLVLQEVARRLQEKIADKGKVGRLGGDEFLIILHGYENEQQVQQLCLELKQLVALPVLYGEISLQVGTSIGTSFYPQDGTDYQQLRKVADARMYEDKG